MYVHRMVLRAFNGEPKDGMTASHIDGDPTNNNINNLVWELHKDNILRKNGHETMLRGQDTPSAKLLDNQVRQIKEFLQFKALSQTNIARLFNVSNSAISAIHTGKTWRHI